MKKAFFTLIIALSFAPLIKAGVDPEIHRMCKDVNDYLGCVKANSKSGFKFFRNKKEKIDKNAKRKFTRDDGYNVVFDPKSVEAVKIRGNYGRYLKFNYRINYYQGSSYIPKTQITPDRVSTNTYGTINSYGSTGSFSGNSYSTITPGASFGGFSIPGGMRSRLLEVTADCQDYTADIKGDGRGWLKLKGSEKDTQVSSEMVLDFMNEFCPQMENLVLNAEKFESNKEVNFDQEYDSNKNHDSGEYDWSEYVLWMSDREKRKLKHECKVKKLRKMKGFGLCKAAGFWDQKLGPNLENSKQDPLWKGYSHHTEMTAEQKKYMEKDCQKAGSTMYRREKLERCRDSGLFDPSEYSWTGWRYKKR